MVSPRSRRPAVYASDEQNLVSLRERLLDARATAQADRSGTPRIPERSRAVEAALLERLEAFASALTNRRLPIPRRLRDELRLRRLLSPPDRD